MSVYRVHFVDHGDDLYDVVELEMHDDEAAIEQAHRIHLQSSGGGFEVWQSNRLVYKHRN